MFDYEYLTLMCQIKSKSFELIRFIHRFGVDAVTINQHVHAIENGRLTSLAEEAFHHAGG